MSPAWTIKGFLEVKDNVLHIDGVSTLELAQKYDTPLFVFSENRINHNVKKLLNISTETNCRLKVCYAAKANANLDILTVIKEAGSDIEVNSGGELLAALRVGFRPDQIVFNGTSKTEAELTEAVKSGIYAIQADSLFEVKLIEKVAKQMEKRANVSLRLVPEIETDTLHGLQTALLKSKFGMMPEEALKAFRIWKSDDKYLNLCGVHLHLGSQNQTHEPYLQAMLTLFKNLSKIHNETGHKLDHLNLGGGFPVNYLRDDTSVADIDPESKEFLSANFKPRDVIRSVWNKVEQFAEKSEALYLLENIELLIEPGRSVIADAGICLTKVRNQKERPIRTVNPENSDRRTTIPKSVKDAWLLTDAGFNILLSMETYKWYYHLISAERAGEPHKTPYKVAGPLCDGGDVYFDIEGKKRLPDYRLLPENMKVGNVLALLNCGAYSVSQMFPYNGRELPTILLVKNGLFKIIRDRNSINKS